MKKNNRMVKRLSYAFFALLLPVSAAADPTTAEQAEQVVSNWLALDQQPLGANLGTAVEDVQAYNDENGEPLYYVVNLSPKGFVIVSGDDYVEPIIAFIPEGEYDPSDKKPLGALVSGDVPRRIQYVRKIEAASGTAALQEAENDNLLKAQEKWDWLEQKGTGNQFVQPAGLPTLSDIRVAPLLACKWNQETVNDSSGNPIKLYNKYTPNNYPSGCVATAMSQMMWYRQHTTAVNTTTNYTIKYKDSADTAVPYQSKTVQLMGGAGTAGAYVWSNMPAVPEGAITDDSEPAKAIGRLLHDAGASVCMEYDPTGAGASTVAATSAFKNTFGYSNSVLGGDLQNNIPADDRNKMTNPNLDAGYPVMYGITDSAGGNGHAIVCDGYGYDAATMYHHLNMGWGGQSDAWYNLPNIDGDAGYQNGKITDITYNIYTSGTGEIISGRVTDSSGNPLDGVTITATTGGVNYTASTNAKGIYALKNVPSASEYTINGSKEGYTFSSQNVSTGTSANSQNLADPNNPCGGETSGAGTVGNLWGVDFAASAANGPEIDIKGNNVSIVSGDTTPSTADHTDFGKTSVGTPVSRTYTIANTGNETLNLTDTPAISLTGTECTSEFTITAQPTVASIAAGSTTTFTVQYSPTDTKDSDICTVTIGNNDSNENPYTFTIKGAEGSKQLVGVYKLLL